MFTIDGPTTVSEEVFNRLFTDAFDYVSIERQRLGDDNLKQLLWGALNNDTSITRAYKIDDYIVGCSVVAPIEIGGLRYMHYIQPTYGCDQNGSRAWWYSEDFVKVGRQWMEANNFDAICVVHNPSSPASVAVANHFGSEFNGVRYFNTPEVLTLDQFFGAEDPDNPRNLPDTMRVFKITLA